MNRDGEGDGDVTSCWKENELGRKTHRVLMKNLGRSRESIQSHFDFDELDELDELDESG